MNILLDAQGGGVALDPISSANPVGKGRAYLLPLPHHFVANPDRCERVRIGVSRVAPFRRLPNLSLPPPHSPIAAFKVEFIFEGILFMF